MSQTSSTPGRVQSDDSRPQQSALEEIQQLKKALERAQRANAFLREDYEKERAEKMTLRIDLEELQSSSHGTSSDQISIQKWQDLVEEARRVAEEAERRAAKAEREIAKMRDVKFENLLGTMGKACIEELNEVWPMIRGAMEKACEEKVNQAWPGLMRTMRVAVAEEMGFELAEKSVPNDKGEVDRQLRAVTEEMGHDVTFDEEESVPNDEGEVDRQVQAIAEEMGLDVKYVKKESVPEDEGEVDEREVDRQLQALTQASEDEEIDYQDQQSDQASENENEEHSSTHDPDREITDLEYAPRQVYDALSMRYRGTQGSGTSPTYDPDTLSSLEDDSQYRSSKIRVSLPPMLDSGSPEQSSIRDLEGTSSQPLSPPPPSPPSTSSEPQPSQTLLRLMRHSDQYTPSANDTGSGPDIINPLENLGDMQEALSTLSGNSKQKEQEFPGLPKGSSQIPGIPTASTAPPITKRPTPIPAIHKDSWDRLGAVSRKSTLASKIEGWADDGSDTDDQPEEPKPKPKPLAMSSVAAGKQPERPSPAKEASSVTGGKPPQPPSTRSYAGTTQAPPPKVQDTAQSSRTVLKPGTAAPKAAVPQTDAPPADQADNTSGFQTVPLRRNRGSGGRGGGTPGQGEAGSNKGGHQGPKIGQFWYQGRGGRGGNQKGGNQGASQGQARS